MDTPSSARSAEVQNVVYPESDGKPMADNTLQFQWIVKIQGGLDLLFADRLDVFVAGDLFWYPVEGDNKTRVAPDILVAFGRPKGHRGSYRQWEEGGIAPQVVFEVLSPGNRLGEMLRKYDFYTEHGVEEFYIYDPDGGELVGHVRRGNRLREIDEIEGWVSPRLGVKFERGEGELRLLGPSGKPLQTYVELGQRAERLAAKLRELGVDPDS